MKLERKNENFTRKKLHSLECGNVFLRDLGSSPFVVYQDKDCETRYLNLESMHDEELNEYDYVFICDANLSYCVKSSLNG